jgi:hypothetical protein
MSKLNILYICEPMTTNYSTLGPEYLGHKITRYNINYNVIQSRSSKYDEYIRNLKKVIKTMDLCLVDSLSGKIHIGHCEKSKAQALEKQKIFARFIVDIIYIIDSMASDIELSEIRRSKTFSRKLLAILPPTLSHHLVCVESHTGDCENIEESEQALFYHRRFWSIIGDALGTKRSIIMILCPFGLQSLLFHVRPDFWNITLQTIYPLLEEYKDREIKIFLRNSLEEEDLILQIFDHFTPKNTIGIPEYIAYPLLSSLITMRENVIYQCEQAAVSRKACKTASRHLSFQKRTSEDITPDTIEPECSTKGTIRRGIITPKRCETSSNEASASEKNTIETRYKVSPTKKDTVEEENNTETEKNPSPCKRRKISNIVRTLYENSFLEDSTMENSPNPLPSPCRSTTRGRSTTRSISLTISRSVSRSVSATRSVTTSPEYMETTSSREVKETSENNKDGSDEPYNPEVEWISEEEGSDNEKENEEENKQCNEVEIFKQRVTRKVEKRFNATVSNTVGSKKKHSKAYRGMIIKKLQALKEIVIKEIDDIQEELVSQHDLKEKKEISNYLFHKNKQMEGLSLSFKFMKIESQKK